MIAALIATCGGLGYAPFMPGTVASVAAAIICWVLRITGMPMPFLWSVTLLLAVLGWWATKKMIHSLGLHDPACVVIDEWVAVWMVCLCVQPTTFAFILSVVLFRFFDIYKPWPVSFAEKLPGAWGVMADDIIAGLFALILVLVLQ